MASYSLRRAGSSQVLVSRDKVSFCLRDNYRVPRQRVDARRHFGRCSRNSQQGISPGWVDLYKADLSGQWLRLPANVGSDVLCLDLKADPLGRLVETDETDNATSVAFRVDGEDSHRELERLSLIPPREVHLRIEHDQQIARHFLRWQTYREEIHGWEC
jgi:hypothetical protein